MAELPSDPDDFPPPPDDPEEGSGPRGFLPDVVKKAIVAGVTAVFMTEEGARRLARDWKLPKDLIGGIVGTAASAKDEILRVFSEEVRNFLESEAVRREFWKALSSMAIEVKAEIRLKPADGDRVKPEVRATVRPHRPRKKAE